MKIRKKINQPLPWIQFLPVHIQAENCEDMDALSEHCFWWNHIEEAVRDMLEENHGDDLGDYFEEIVNSHIRFWRLYEKSALYYEFLFRERGKYEFGKPWLELSPKQYIELSKRWPVEENEIGLMESHLLHYIRLTEYDAAKTIKEKIRGSIYDRPNWTKPFIMQLNLNWSDKSILNAVQKEIIDQQRKIKGVPSPPGQPPRVYTPKPRSSDFIHYPEDLPKPKIQDANPVYWKIIEFYDTRIQLTSARG